MKHDENHTEEQYGDMVKTLWKSGEQLLSEMTPFKAQLNHIVIGLCNEIGELADPIKAHCMYDKPLDVKNIMEELGDIEFGLQALRMMLNIERATILLWNMDKLGKRYGKDFQYSNDAAIARADKQGE